MDNENYQMVSVSTVARRMGVTAQTIYNQIKAGLWETTEYQRGKYRGILVKFPKK